MFALSFFETLDAARRRYRSLAERVDAPARYGTHVGMIQLLPADGMISEPSKDGHMDLHPENDIGFAGRIAGYSSATEGTE